MVIELFGSNGVLVHLNEIFGLMNVETRVTLLENLSTFFDIDRLRHLLLTLVWLESVLSLGW